MGSRLSAAGGGGRPCSLEACYSMRLRSTLISTTSSRSFSGSFSPLTCSLKSRKALDTDSCHIVALMTMNEGCECDSLLRLEARSEITSTEKKLPS